MRCYVIVDVLYMLLISLLLLQCLLPLDLHLCGSFFRMILSVKGEAAKSEDMFAQIEEILISVRMAFLNCFLDFAGTTFHHNSLIIISTCNCPHTPMDA